MRQNATVIGPVVPVLDTSAYASGDVLWTTPVVIPNACRIKGGVALLKSLYIVDFDDQGVAFDLFFQNAASSLGTVNGAPNISDANALASIVGRVPIATTDYVDLGGVRIARPTNAVCESMMQALTSSRDLYISAVNGAGTPTFTAAGLKFFFGFEQYPFGYAG